MPQFTDYADVASRWLGGDIPATEDQVLQLLSDAEDVMLREFPDIAERIAAGSLPVERVQRVAARMVIRYLANPAGAQQAQQTAGPFTETIQYARPTAEGIYLTDQDRADLSVAAGRRAFTINTMPLGVLIEEPDPWITWEV